MVATNKIFVVKVNENSGLICKVLSVATIFYLMYD